MPVILLIRDDWRAIGVEGGGDEMEGNFEVVGDRGELASIRLSGAIEQFYEAAIVEPTVVTISTDALRPNGWVQRPETREAGLPSGLEMVHYAMLTHPTRSAETINSGEIH